ncbi:cyclic pyranopterin monophosphate synthase MoaC [Desulfofalx alkaliphila]|uniref:cyclic pyranopterin monophosphate synthase MoaC n=1 Tax=Desulfofalx alkaliphila TaxID=105483 RepID=UPI0004E1FFCA|nr:cyclic pyranopterin monophosphate synthase MoaC [Desulfofalx alkaliphila]
MAELTHFDLRGNARMVEVGLKKDTMREAVARGEVVMKPETLAKVERGSMTKGDVLGVARVAAIMGAKETPRLIPMAHPILITGVDVNFRIVQPNRVEIEASVRTTGKTGVEMEALCAVNVAALTIYDMCKAVDKEMVIQNIRLIKKSGGKSGEFVREGEQTWE